ncbi:MAG: hypothetical protein E7161_01220 [Firmicutes bacterium]|nr:hypothetical protein [Bacillota bacterium]
MKCDFSEMDEKEKNAIKKEIKKPLYVFNEFIAFTENYVINFTPLNSWVIKYDDIKQVKFSIQWKIQTNFHGFNKVVKIYDGHNWKKFKLNQSSLPFFYYEDVEIINKISKIIRERNKAAIIKDVRINKKL